MSLPSRECGLKFWGGLKHEDRRLVTPLAGVWFEIYLRAETNEGQKSLPSRECGLKSLWDGI